ncbi:DsbA family protein [Ochrobactrum sp. EDr1-4]|uniref:DsbA family protein n=1 Tax=Ochrobactrum sp. EDr1-4 TaxID=3368622 RepID=UPI003BA26881
MSKLSIPVSKQDHIQGYETAAVTLVEYGDYECPYCGEAYYVLKALQQTMGEHIRFVFRNFPLVEMHTHALHAAEFAEMAATQDLFWQAHDFLYKNQSALTNHDLREYANALGITPVILETAFDERFQERIETDFRGGLRSGVNGTPTLFIYGTRYDGARDLVSLKAYMNDMR